MILGHAHISTHDADLHHVEQEARDDARTRLAICSEAVSDTGTVVNCGWSMSPFQDHFQDVLPGGAKGI
jgi:hypothetical protein